MEMTQEWIHQYNKKCAEFLNFKKYPIKEKADGYVVNFKNGKVPFESCISNSQFHSDWNWIMAVVEAIEKLDVLHSKYASKYDILIDCFSCSIMTTGYHIKTILTIDNTNKKQAVVQAIDQFIDWYNKQK